MTGTARAKAKVAVKAVKPQKPKYALVFFEDKKEQSVVTVSDIKGEPTVGEYRDVQWTPDECFRAKVVLIGPNKSVLSKITLDLYGNIYDTSKGPQSAAAQAEKSRISEQNKIDTQNKLIVNESVYNNLMSKVPFIVDRSNMSQEGRPPGQNYHEFPSGNSQTHYVGLSPQAACSSDATVHASGPQQQWLSGQNSGATMQTDHQSKLCIPSGSTATELTSFQQSYQHNGMQPESRCSVKVQQPTVPETAAIRGGYHITGGLSPQGMSCGQLASVSSKPYQVGSSPQDACSSNAGFTTLYGGNPKQQWSGQNTGGVCPEDVQSQHFNPQSPSGSTLHELSQYQPSHQPNSKGDQTFASRSFHNSDTFSAQGRPSEQSSHQFGSGSSKPYQSGPSAQAACSSDAAVETTRYSDNSKQQWSGQNTGGVCPDDVQSQHFNPQSPSGSTLLELSPYQPPHQPNSKGDQTFASRSFHNSDTFSAQGRPSEQSSHQFASGSSKPYQSGPSAQAACSSDAAVETTRYSGNSKQQWSGQNTGGVCPEDVQSQHFNPQRPSGSTLHELSQYQSPYQPNSKGDQSLATPRSYRAFGNQMNAGDNQILQTSDRPVSPGPGEEYFLETVLKLASPEVVQFVESLAVCLKLKVQSRQPPQADQEESGVNLQKSYPSDMNRGVKGRVEISLGSGVWISKRQFNTMVTRNTVLLRDPQELLRQLLKATVGEENLAEMSADGRKDRLKVPDRILRPIKTFVKGHFPNDIAEHQKFTKTVNNMCQQIRGTLAKQRLSSGKQTTSEDEPPPKRVLRSTPKKDAPVSLEQRPSNVPALNFIST